MRIPGSTAGAAILLGAGVLACWISDLMVHWRSLPEFQHGWLVPPLAGFLVSERWPGRPETRASEQVLSPLILGFVSLAFLLAARLYRLAVAHTPASSFVLSLGCAGLILAILWLGAGRAWMLHFGFSVAFLFVAVPLPASLWQPLVGGLQHFVAAVNVEGLNLFGIPATRSGTLIHLAKGTVGVDEACSGVRSLQSSIMAALFIADVTLRRWPLRVFLWVSGVALAVAGNVLRAMFLSLAAARGGVSAVDRVHDAAGWSVLGFTVAGLALLAWRTARIQGRLDAELKLSPGEAGGSAAP